jgi:IS30 family transposase
LWNSANVWATWKSTPWSAKDTAALVNLVERKSRYTLLQPVTQRFANWEADATILLLNPFADSAHTITGGNGKEFAKHVVLLKY